MKKPNTTSLIAKMKAKAAAKLSASKADESMDKPTQAFAIVKKIPPPVREFEQNVAAAATALPQGSITMPLKNIVSA